MRNPDYKNDIIHSKAKPPLLPSAILETLRRPSNQIIVKNSDGSLEGLRYVVATEPSTLRPVKAWTILIEQWFCKTMADITAQDILFIRLLNVPADKAYETASGCVRDIIIMDDRIDPAADNGFNAVMAAGVMINKIDAGRMPDIQKTLQSHRLLN